MISKIKLVLLILISEYLVKFGFSMAAWALFNCWTINGNNYSFNEMVWGIFGAVSCLIWLIYFGRKIKKIVSTWQNKFFLILFILLSYYMVTMFYDIPIQIVSCFQNQNTCTIRWQRGIDCMPKIGGERQKDLREIIFGTWCVFG